MQRDTSASTHDIDFVVSRFQGFLKALEIITGGDTAFTVSCLELGDVPETSLAHHISGWNSECRYLGSNEISGSEVHALLRKEVFSKLALPENIEQELEWWFQEYFGLISTAVHPEGPFNPLESAPLLEVQVRKGELVAGRFILVKSGAHGILFGMRKSLHNKTLKDDAASPRTLA